MFISIPKSIRNNVSCIHVLTVSILVNIITIAIIGHMCVLTPSGCTVGSSSIFGRHRLLRNDTSKKIDNKLNLGLSIKGKSSRELNSPEHHHHIGGHSYQCSAEEIQFQASYADMVGTSICDTRTPWSIAQLLLPDATVFFDVGCNRGYTSALIFGLWSPGDAFNPVSD